MNPQSAGQAADKGIGISKSSFTPISRPTLMQDRINSKDKSKPANIDKFVSKLPGQAKRTNLKDLSKVPDSVALNVGKIAGIKRTETLETIKKPAPLPKKEFTKEK